MRRPTPKPRIEIEGAKARANPGKLPSFDSKVGLKEFRLMNFVVPIEEVETKSELGCKLRLKSSAENLEILPNEAGL